MWGGSKVVSCYWAILVKRLNERKGRGGDKGSQGSENHIKWAVDIWISSIDSFMDWTSQVVAPIEKKNSMEGPFLNGSILHHYHHPPHLTFKQFSALGSPLITGGVFANDQACLCHTTPPHPQNVVNRSRSRSC